MARWESIGLLFDIDALIESSKSNPNYGGMARLIFMKHLVPRRIGAAFLWHGDTRASAIGPRCWCIAVSARDQGAITAFHEMFDNVEAAGLLPHPQRYMLRPIDLIEANGSLKPDRREDLTQWLAIDSEGVIIPAGALGEDVALCRHFGHPFRLPEKLAALLTQIHDGSVVESDIYDAEEFGEISGVMAAVDVEKPGVPGTLMRLAKAFATADDEMYSRYCANRLADSLDWAEAKIASRPDQADVRAVREYLKSLGYDPI